MSNFKYTLKPGYYDSGELQKLEENSYYAFDSVCYQTMVGMIQHKDDKGVYGCFYGSKLNHIEIEDSQEIEKDEENQVVFFSDRYYQKK